MKFSNPQEAWYHGLNQKPQGEGCLPNMVSVTFLALAIALMLAFSSCTTTKYVPVEHHTTDTVYQSKLQRDSVWLHDSIHVSEKGDTVRIEKWHTKFIEKVSHDTTYVATHDTIPQPYPVTQYVEKPLSKIQKTLIGVGIFALMGIIIFAVWKLKKFLPL